MATYIASIGLLNLFKSTLSISKVTRSWEAEVESHNGA